MELPSSSHGRRSALGKKLLDARGFTPDELPMLVEIPKRREAGPPMHDIVEGRRSRTIRPVREKLRDAEVAIIR